MTLKSDTVKQATHNHSAPCTLQACEECGLIVDLPKLQDEQKASCPRCKHTMITQRATPFHSIEAYGLAILVMLALSCSFSFMSFSVQGLSQQVTLIDAATSMHHFQNTLLTLLMLLCVLLLPFIYVCVQMYLYYQARLLRNGRKINIGRATWLCRSVFSLEPWLMADVFLIGILVAMVKIVSLADVGLGPSFWAFCLYAILIIKFVSTVDNAWLWDQFIPKVRIDGVKEGDTHLDKNHIACHSCGQLNPYDADGGNCLRCHGKLHAYNPQKNIQWAWALLIAAALFYIPANLYPIMYTTSVGQTEASTIISGVVLLWHYKSYPVAMVIFFASVVIPIAKIIMLCTLYRNTTKASTVDYATARKNIKLYRVTEFIGRWSMIDIFVVALLAALVQLNELMAIEPGQAALSFATVVILTMFSALIFDSRSLWQRNDAAFIQESSSPFKSNKQKKGEKEAFNDTPETNNTVKTTNNKTLNNKSKS